MGINSKTDQIGKPDFLGIGAARTGTTWLSHCLSKHSQIYIPPTEPGSKYELHCFNRYQSTTASFLRRCFRTLPRLMKEKIKGVRVEDPGQTLFIIRKLLSPQSALFVPCHLLIFPYKVYRKMMRRNTDKLRWLSKYYLGRLYLNPENWYASLFEPTGQQICGEITPMYSLLPDSSIEYMQSFNKDMRFIYLIRNPIEREWSNISLLTMNPGSSLPISVVQKWDHRLQAFNDYLSILKKYLNYVAPENLFLGFYEDIMFHQDRFLATVQKFLGVSIENISRKAQYTGGYKK